MAHAASVRACVKFFAGNNSTSTLKFPREVRQKLDGRDEERVAAARETA